MTWNTFEKTIRWGRNKSIKTWLVTDEDDNSDEEEEEEKETKR